METVRAKFVCNNVEDCPQCENKNVSFNAVYDDGLENKSFSKYTPAANLTMTISYETPAVNFFEQGKEYYLDFTAAEKEQ